LVSVSAVLLVGPTGSGKTPLGDFLERTGLGGRACRHFDFGVELRRLAASPAPPPGFSVDDLDVIRHSLATGALFGDAELPLALKIVKMCIEPLAICVRDLVVLNGFPRHENQARALEGLVFVELVVLLEIAPETLVERIRLDPDGDRGGRADDSDAAILERFKAFRDRTLPLVEFYERQGARVLRVPVSMTTTAETIAPIIGKG
jgi:adenylate kinase